MSLTFAPNVRASLDGVSIACTPLAGERAPSTPNAEIADRLGLVDAALNRLESVISNLTDRLDPAMAPAGKADGGPDNVTGCVSSTLIGKRLECHETYINRSTEKLLDIMDRLGI